MPAEPSDDADEPELDESFVGAPLADPSLAPGEPDESVLDPAESLLEESLLEPSVADDALVPDELEDERSFFAQPEPLKWIDGAENPFRTGAAPHTGQTVGPSALTPWITSNRWSFGQR